MANKTLSVLLTILLTQLSYGSVNLERLFHGDDRPVKQPTLYVTVGEPNGAMVRAEDVNLPKSGRLKIVVATHGWFEREPWPKDLALAIRDKVDANEWLCGWFDWRKEAKVVNPRDAAEYARDKAGPILAEQILALSKEPQHIHLIAHSAGCWAISAAAKIIAKKTKASIHLTFLDAYIPLGWDANSLGDIITEPNTIYWADHYLTQDITLKVTNCLLAHAHNVDIGDITPGLKDHRFPFHWYPATVLGKYAPKDKYVGKTLLCKSGNIEYGFARSLEAGEQNWSKSLTLPMGKEATKIEKPTK
ncbi:MAG: hypothetical protein MUO27_06070 [Sedimentisphaerales bacterium]|nr:hypothetical protein [Sedimentisphaerales bacterium]